MPRFVAWSAVAAAVAVMVLADFIAADHPIVAHIDGSSYWFANIVEHDDFVGMRSSDISESLGPDDWAVWSPIRWGPTSIRGAGGIEPLQAPSSAHWLGTDDRGRDVLARLIHGSRATFTTVAGAVLLSLIFGMVLALGSVLGRPATDHALVAVSDAVAAVPGVVLVVAVYGLIGTGGLWVAAAMIAVPRVADVARLARSAMRIAQVEDYVRAARAVGASRRRIVLTHLLPATANQVAVAASVTAATAVLAEAALTFLGFGAPSPMASWGELFRQAADNDLRWWLALPPGLSVTGLALACAALAPRPKLGRRRYREFKRQS